MRIQGEYPPPEQNTPRWEPEVYTRWPLHGGNPGDVYLYNDRRYLILRRDETVILSQKELSELLLEP